MTPNPVTVADDEAVTHLLGHTMARHHCSAFPVVDGAGRCVGLITLRRLRSLDPATRSACTVGDVMIPVAALAHAAPDDDALAALGRRADGDGRLLVFDDDHLVGIVSPSDLDRMLDLARLRGGIRA